MKVLLVLVALLHLSWAGFDLSLAKRNVLMSFSSYCGDNVDQNFDCYWCNQVGGFNWVSNFGDSGGDFFGFAGYFQKNQEVVVAIRGTDNIAGWIADGHFNKVPYGNVAGALVHEGFYDAWTEYGLDVMDIVYNITLLCPSCNSITVTGHSLGAALATLAAVDIQNVFNKSLSLVLYDFGSPRVGNQAFASFADSELQYNTYRVVVVLPSQINFAVRSMDYYHLAEEVWWTGSKWIDCNMSGEDPSCSDSQSIGNPLDHASYVGFNALDGVPHGCMWTDP